MFDNPQEINLSDIDTGDERYRIASGSEDIGPLALSIRETGLICPPVVRPVEGGQFIIVSGFNRIRALRRNGETKVLVRPVAPGTGDYHCLLISIAGLAFKRPLSQAELVISLRRLSGYLDREAMAGISLSVFNTRLARGFIDDLLDAGSLPDPALELIGDGRLSLKSAKRISRLDSEGILFFLEVFSKIRATASVQLELIQNILETAAREGFHPKSLFRELKNPSPLDDESLDPIQRTRDFRSLVFEQRYPELSRTRRAVREKIASIGLSGAVKLVPPENFEGRNYSLSFTAKNYDEFRENLRRLTEASENKILREILHS